MPTSLAQRVKRIRELKGYGGDRQAAEFARLIGIRPASLHNLESGRTLNLGKALAGLLKIGASLRYLQTGVGKPMEEQEFERLAKDEALHSMIDELDEHEKQSVEDLVKGYIRRKKGSSPNDPFKLDPPGYSKGTQ